jgi:hypothetical protein
MDALANSRASSSNAAQLAVSITGREHTAIALRQARDWTAAVDTDGEPRPIDEAAVAEITGLLPASTRAAYPPGTRVIVRRERPHPGAQLDLIEQRDGYRYTGLATDTRVGQPRPRPRRGPHPHQPRHRPRASAQPIVRHQRRVWGARTWHALSGSGDAGRI